VVADVEVDRASGKVRVTRALSAVDGRAYRQLGRVVNQSRAASSSTASWTLMEEVRYDRTRVSTRSWRTTRSSTRGRAAGGSRSDQRPEERSSAVEGSQGPAAAAIANPRERYRQRLRALPCTGAVKQALA